MLLILTEILENEGLLFDCVQNCNFKALGWTETRHSDKLLQKV